MQESILEELGLTKSEISVYIALLHIGPSTTGPLIKEAAIASGKAYLVLDKLVTKGLVTHTINSGIKTYQSKDPIRLLDYLQEKKDKLLIIEKELKEYIPKLQKFFNQHKIKTIAEVFEGTRGFKTFHRFMLDELKKGDTICIFGAAKEANDRFEGFFKDWNIERAKKGVFLKILYNASGKLYGEQRKKVPLTEVRYMNKSEETPAWVDIFGDYVVTINVHNKPICFLIKDEITKKSYQQYFENLWDKANKI